jgi:uncharacterized protein
MTTSSLPPGLALVTGASSGIGLELARLLAADGYDLIVCAEDAELDTAAQQLRAHGTTVTPVRADLTDPGAVEQLWSAVLANRRPLELAALNAGVGLGKAFVDQDLQRALGLVDLNVRSTVHLAHHVLRQMVGRGSGRVLITSSIASTQPGSFQAVYNATKSFTQSFAEALQDELRDTAVTVTSLMPGPTETEFFERADLMDTRVGQSGSKDDAADVARQGYEAWLAGKRRVVAAGLTTKAMEAADKVTPDRLKAAAHRLMAEPKNS